ncbi:MAG: family ATPase [Dehalococcoidia bacterium]|nr:family ATPase [Dehalococcoidia bacterium]
MKRVLVIGSGGAGKSTLARQLGALLGIEVIHLDSLFWKPGWVETPKTEWLSTVEELAKREAWIMDGNYSATLAPRLAAADAVVLMNFPRRICLWRVVKRRFQYIGRSRPDMAPGCPERLDWSFLKWIWTYPTRSRPRVREMIDQYSDVRTVIELRTPLEVSQFLRDVESEQQGYTKKEEHHATAGHI